MNREVAKMELPSHDKRQVTPGRIGAGVARARRGSRRLLLLYVGAGASMYDSVAGLVTTARRLVHTAERRGERIEDTLVRRFRQVEENTVDQLRQLQDGIKLDDARTTLGEALEQSQDGLAEQIQAVLQNLGIPNRDQLDRLNRDIDQLNAKLDRELQRQLVLA